MIDDLLAKYPNDVKVVIKNFPLGSHKQARKAAQYALAADKQGKYKEMYHKIFETWKELKNNEDLPKQIAAELGLDIDQLMEDTISKVIRGDMTTALWNMMTSVSVPPVLYIIGSIIKKIKTPEIVARKLFELATSKNDLNGKVIIADEP